MYVASNMTTKEFLRINGYVTREQAETLVDLGTAAEEVGDLGSLLSEVKTGFPEEDFLGGPIRALQGLARVVRGSNRQRVVDLIGELNMIQSEINGQVEYAQEELKKVELAARALNKALEGAR